MDLSGQRVLAYLQEDNTQRVLFRVRPLLSPQGSLAAEDIAAYKDHGFLRVAPDRQEQHTFKERMRELGSLCVLDLKDAAQGKVRPNRNYAPARGENNRYIVYSDAIRALPKDMVYEVVTREDSRHAPLTPRYYVRSGGFINGPFSSGGQETEGPSQTLPPDCDRLFLVTMPDNQHRMFYWPETPEETPDGGCGKAPEAPRAQPEPHGGGVRTLADLFFRRRQPLLMQAEGLRPAAAAAEEAMRRAGFACGTDQAAHLLMIFLLFERFQLSSPAVADAVTAGETLAALFGLNASLYADSAAPRAGAECLLLSPQASVPGECRRHVIVSQSSGVALQNAAAYALAPWPVAVVEALDGWSAEAAVPAALNLDQLQQQLGQQQMDLSPAVTSRLSAWQRGLSSLEAPLPLKLRRDTARYLRHALALMPDEQTALSFAAAAFVLPYAQSKGITGESLAGLFADQPEVMKLL